MPDSQTGVTDGTGRKAPNASSARARSRLRTGTQRASSPPSPTRSMEPGHVHYRIAGEVLKGIQRKAAESGIELDVGEVPNVDTQDENGNVDPERLTKIVARIIARGGDRISVFRRISRHLEGQDKRSGLLSDITAAVIELYKRNPDTFHDLGKQAATDFNARRVQRAATKETPQTNGGMSNASR